MIVVTDLDGYRDDDGNEVVASTAQRAEIRVKFRGGRNNRLVVDDEARLGTLYVDFDCDNGTLTIGPSKRVAAFSGAIRVGQDGTVSIGRNVSCTSIVAMSATEGTRIDVGDDVMFASDNELRADDGHPIFDVGSGRRVNVSTSIEIGSHVWLARRSVVLGGGRMGDGSVLGYGAVLTRRIPNNCVAAGVPARVVRRDVAWERPHLSLVKPYYKPDSSTVKISKKYWRPTRDADPASRPQRLRRRLRATAVGTLLMRVRRRVRRGGGAH